MALDVDRARTAPGTLIFPWPINGAVHQQWYDHPASGTIRSRLGPNLCMDIIGKTCYFRIRLYCVNFISLLLMITAVKMIQGIAVFKY